MYIMYMQFTWNPIKRAQTIAERGLDFADMAYVFASPMIRKVDRRHNYGEIRYVLLGVLDGEVVAAAVTIRDNTVRVFSLRKADRNERKKYRQTFP